MNNARNWKQFNFICCAYAFCYFFFLIHLLVLNVRISVLSIISVLTCLPIIFSLPFFFHLDSSVLSLISFSFGLKNFWYCLWCRLGAVNSFSFFLFVWKVLITPSLLKGIFPGCGIPRWAVLFGSLKISILLSSHSCIFCWEVSLKPFCSL